jgi:hypothetical protein
MDDWLRNMGDWNISRRRYYGLPLPFYPCSCGHVNVIGSKDELRERGVEGFDQLAELRRPWVDRVPIRCEACGETVQRVTEVGDVWLDAGIVPFATLGWENPEWIPEGYATGAAKGLTHADLPDHAYWEQWFPADWVSEMREQIRLWFYSQLFMSVALVGKAPYRRVLGYEKPTSTAADARLVGNAFGRGRVRAHGRRRRAMYAQPPDRNLLGFGWLRDRAQAADAVNQRSCHPDIEGRTRSPTRTGPPAEQPLDHGRRAHKLVRQASDAYEARRPWTIRLQ